MKVTINEWFIIRNMDFNQKIILANHTDAEIVRQTEKAFFLSVKSPKGTFEKWFPKSVVAFEGVEGHEPNPEPEASPERRPRREYKERLNGVFGVEGLKRMTDFLESWGVPLNGIQTTEEAEAVMADFGLTDKWKEGM